MLNLAGKDATEAFYSLHRQEVLQRPQYKRLQIGSIKGESSKINPLGPGELSQVPYAEPTWLSKGFFSPFYSEVRPIHVIDDDELNPLLEQGHRAFQKKMRQFVDEHVAPEAQVCRPTLLNQRGRLTTSLGSRSGREESKPVCI